MVLPPRFAPLLLGRCVLPQGLQHHHLGILRQRKIDDLAGNLPRRIVVEMADFLPQVNIVWDVVL